ncbi:guanine nucleotide-binding protein subunit gamma 2-like [Dioscorea cayenensis subsp. rotundata]|uniref:Guanine nucleotide-binding protein subunit gamma 2-like n=1 Tax=Dioscorea cayennensis subsp. rotundata TaxID=55577 RepID=A0AB40CJ20_DIOCR|nr:guanine nucleotide-binding protein subunit gamma 2-like [Dioscorea cayenensis subsp. rotundata]
MQSTVAAEQSTETKGKHRLVTELKRLEAETRFLEEDMEQLEKTEKASAVLQELLNEVERRPDPLLPVTPGPANSVWDQWFEGAQSVRVRHRCLIL